MADLAAPVLNVKIETAAWNPGLRLVRLSGRLDAAGVNTLDTALAAESEKPPFRWAADLSAVDYVSSAGVGAFLKLLGQLEKNSGELALFAAQEKTLKVFKLLGFTNSVKHFATEAELKDKF